MTENLVLSPYPRQLTYTMGAVNLQGQTSVPLILSEKRAFAVAKLFHHFLDEPGLPIDIYLSSAEPAAPTAKIIFQTVPNCEQQEYRLAINENQIRVEYTHLQGLFYGCMTLKQIIQQCEDRILPCLTIEDSPDFPQRGFMLDISRDRVPTMTTLLELIDDLASLKINQLQLYAEHTFAYPEHEVVWQHASPLTSEELMTLDQYCAERFIELVPNQNSLGHMDRWLKHSPYHSLAETPDGFVDTNGRWRVPGTLNPLDPQSLELIRGLYPVLLPHFESNYFNVGCDEPFELGRGKCQAEYEKRGGRVYLDWLLALHKIVTQHQHTMMFWGDIIIHYPELIPELPTDIIVMEWGYESTHPFDENCKKYADSGIPFYVCPGTSSWHTLVGRSDNAIGNLKEAASAGLKHGASGYLITDWGDDGHWQPLVASYLGILYGASVAWGYDSNHNLDVAEAMSTNLYRDSNHLLGRVTFEIGNIYRQLPPEHINGQILAYALQWRRDELDKNLARVSKWGGETAKIAPQTLRKITVELRDLQKQLSVARLLRPDADLIITEWRHATNLAIHGAKWLLLMQEQPDYSASDLLAEIGTLQMTQRDLWLRRSRRGGLEDSMARFDLLAEEYRKISSEEG